MMSARATQSAPRADACGHTSGGQCAPAARAQVSHQPRVAAPRLWLALYLPCFPVEILGAQHANAARPFAVTDGRDTASVVVAAGAAAAVAGVHAGMPIGAACARVPNLRLAVRDEAAEAAALEGLAVWAGRFTSCVSLEPPHGLLLEIGGSLALFGGLQALLARVRGGLETLGYSARLGVAPTALGAWLLAKAGLEEPVTAAHALAARLAPVPLECLDLPAQVEARLRRVGVERFGDCCRLPRDGVARRTEPRLLDCLDRALGRRAEVRPAHTPPPTFERRVGLAGEVRDRATLLRVAERLLGELAGFLQARTGGVQALEWHLAHRRAPATRLVVELVAPSRDAGHLLLLLGERLEHVELVEAVVYLGMRARTIVPLAPSSRDLYGEEGITGGDWRALVERLRARLGREAVQGLAVCADHRPERAWRGCPPGARAAAPAARYPRRPLWLLDPPEALRIVSGAPWLDGRLELGCGPERIESGWWDGHDVARDYFEALHPDGACYWIYRELRARGDWYLHGVFA